jgi:hypothetical protein
MAEVKRNSKANSRKRIREVSALKIGQTSTEVLPTGDYIARIEEIEEDNGAYGPQVKFTFEIVEDKLTSSGESVKGKTLLGWASARFNRNTKLYKWTRAALGRDLAPDEPFDSDQVAGRNVTLAVVVQQRDDLSEYNKVTDVRPARNTNEAAPTASSGHLPV